MTYREKIKNRDDLIKIRRERADERWVMVHGVFDLVHPGHIRHLRFAKEKGDILVASITSDQNIEKGEDRPYINQELRAENLAALEIVDYVIIDDNRTPISIINDLKPDIFVKGAEYASNRSDASEKTLEEQVAVETYGGAMIFSSGDIVFSSTKLLEISKPNIENEKLRAMLDAQGVTEDYILGILDSFLSKKVLVVGDTIVDRYTYCTTLGKTTKTPTLSIRCDYSKDFIGGAAIVAQHVRKLGDNNAGFLTLLGGDKTGKMVVEQFEGSDIEFSYVTDDLRPTTVKERFWADGYKLLQVDRVENEPLAGHLLEDFFQEYTKLVKKFDTVVFSDFRHGIFNKRTINKFIDIAKQHKKVIIADSQVSNRWGNIADFQGIDLICPNEDEARFALGDQDIGVLQLGRWLLRKAGGSNLILKLGERGIIAFEKPMGDKNPEKIRDYYPIHSFGDQVIDAVGTGDALLGASSLSMSKDVHLLAVGMLANAAAALSIGQMGNVPIKYEDLKDFVENKLLKDIFTEKR